MHERDQAVATGLIILLLVVVLGFFVHRDPRFAGSLAGGILGIAAACLMLVPLAYLLVKRVPPMKRVVTKVVSLRTFLTIHIYAGIVGSILAVLHGGHAFGSALGVALLSMTLVVTLSGYFGRYLMGRVAAGARDQQQVLAGLREQYARVAEDLIQDPEEARRLRYVAGFFRRLVAPLVLRSAASSSRDSAAVRAVGLAESIADVEYALKSRDTVRSLYSRWLACHVVISIVLYALLVVHVWSAWYFGIRWLS